MNDRVRRIVALHGGLAVAEEQLDDDDDLFAAGLTSHAVVNVLLALEEELGVELPDSSLRRETFRSVRVLADAFARLDVAAI